MEPQPPDSVHPQRRSLLKKLAAAVIGGVIVAVPALAGLRVFFHPLRPKRGVAARSATNGSKDFIDVAPLSALPADGMPHRFQVLAERVDAWNRHPAAPVGAVYLKRSKDPPQQVIAFNVLCPHATCPVEAVPGGAFRCPCHNSGFNPDGSPTPGSVSPRGLDQLEVDPAGLQAGIIRVRFQNFVPGTHEKIPTT